jgi:hypothetical protein
VFTAPRKLLCVSILLSSAWSIVDVNNEFHAMSNESLRVEKNVSIVKVLKLLIIASRSVKRKSQRIELKRLCLTEMFQHVFFNMTCAGQNDDVFVYCCHMQHSLYIDEE